MKASLNSADLSRRRMLTSKKPAKGFLLPILSGFKVMHIDSTDAIHSRLTQKSSTVRNRFATSRQLYCNA